MRRLIEAARSLPGAAPSQRDLELMGHLEIRQRPVAEHVLWEAREALLAGFDALVAAMDAPDVEPGPAPQPEPAMAEPTRVEPTPPEPTQPEPVDPSPEARFGRLMQWRGEHRDPAVAGIGDQDLARLASSGAATEPEVRMIVARLSSQAVVTQYTGQIAAALGGGVAPAEPPAPEPEPEPEPAPEPAATQVDPRAPFAWEKAPSFAPFAWADGPAEPFGHLSAEQDGEGVLLAWTPAPTRAAVTLYRVVESASSWPSGAPELGASVGITRATSGTVTLHPTGPVTYLAVWVNQGDSLLSAAHAQPRLVGVAQIVWPPTELSVQVTANRTVAALLTAPEGSRVEVQRFPKGANVSYDINRELDRDYVSSTGFRDLTPPMGSDLVYAAFCVAELADGRSVVSTPITAVAHVVPEVQQLTVQVARSSSTPGAYDLTWLPPSNGKVYLYATPEHPPHGLENEPRTAEIIEGQGLTPEFRINYPPIDLGGLMTIKDYSVDPSWVRVHFVAVHWVSDESVWVGPAVSMVTPHAPSHAEIVERVDSEIITFAWPEGVTVVQAYQGPTGESLDPAGSEPIAQLTDDEYVRMGGMRITRTLPSQGCAVHLFGVVYLDGRPVYSEPTSLDYPGITRLRYGVVPYGYDGNPAGNAQPASYRLFAEVDDQLHDTSLVIVGRRDRLPLHPTDGQHLQQVNVSLVAGQRSMIAELSFGGAPAFIRAFVQDEAVAGSVAVLDPPIHELEVVTS